MTRKQFLNWLETKGFQAKSDIVKFDDGSVITIDLLGEIIDAIQNTDETTELK